jgi:hypothetical protein
MRLQRENLLRHNRLYSCYLLTSDAFVDVLIAMMHSLHVLSFLDSVHVSFFAWTVYFSLLG